MEWLKSQTKHTDASSDNLKITFDDFLREQNYPNSKNENKIICNIAYKRAHDIYGDELPDIAKNRIEWELSAIAKTRSAGKFLTAKNIVDFADKNDYLVGNGGYVGSSFVAFLLGITQTNPLAPHYICPKCHHVEFVEDEFCGADMNDKHCACGQKMQKVGFSIPAEMFFGLYGEKEPTINLNVSPNLLSLNLRKHSAKIKLFTHDNPTIIHHLYGQTGIDPKSIPLDDKQTFELIASGNAKNIQEFSSTVVQSNAFSVFPPHCIDDLIRLSGILHGAGSWMDNGRKIAYTYNAKLNELISCREDVMMFLIKCGYDRKKAYEVSQNVEDKLELTDSEYNEMMQNDLIPNWYPNSINNIFNLFSRAHAANYVLLQYKIAYYQTHYPEEFHLVMESFGKTNSLDEENAYNLHSDFDIEGATLKKYFGKDSQVVIPNYISEIGELSFCMKTNLISVSMPDTVEEIGDAAFLSCINLADISIPDSVIKINSGAFENCTSLTNITIPDSVTYIGYNAFQGCRDLASINIPNGVTCIDYGTFEDCTSLTNITMPDNVTKIGANAFHSCTCLKNISIPDSVKEIQENAFFNTAYYNDSSNWENGVLYVGNHLIKAKETISGSYKIKEGTKTIADGAFENCTSLTSVNIPESVTSIGHSAFKDCTNLSSIAIPCSVTSIDRDAFENCSSLTIYIRMESSANCCSKCYAERYAEKEGILFEIIEKASEQQWPNIINILY